MILLIQYLNSHWPVTKMGCQYFLKLAATLVEESIFIFVQFQCRVRGTGKLVWQCLAFMKLTLMEHISERSPSWPTATSLKVSILINSGTRCNYSAHVTTYFLQARQRFTTILKNFKMLMLAQQTNVTALRLSTPMRLTARSKNLLGCQKHASNTSKYVFDSCSDILIEWWCILSLTVNWLLCPTMAFGWTHKDSLKVTSQGRVMEIVCVDAMSMEHAAHHQAMSSATAMLSQGWWKKPPNVVQHFHTM